MMPRELLAGSRPGVITTLLLMSDIFQEHSHLIVSSFYHNIVLAGFTTLIMAGISDTHHYHGNTAVVRGDINCNDIWDRSP